MDINPSAIPAVINDPSVSVAEYLRYLQRDVPFSRNMLAYLVEHRRLIYRERVNETRHLVFYKPGNVVMVKVAVQSKRSVGRVAKLVY